MTPKLKPKKCKACGETYTPWSTMQQACSPKCALELVAIQKKRQQKRKESHERRLQREAKRSCKPLSYFVGQAQKAFNEFIRERDYDKPCMTHGYDCPNAHRGWDAGHFHSVGKQPALRFNCWNAHKQCSTTNRGSHKYSKYERSADKMNEENLVIRIGQDRVDWLNGPHEPKQYRREDLERVARIFRKRARLYRKIREARLT